MSGRRIGARAFRENVERPARVSEGELLRPVVADRALAGHGGRRSGERRSKVRAPDVAREAVPVLTDGKNEAFGFDVETIWVIHWFPL